jgi:diguanylate cyclase (GGDEF)-like protein
VNKLFDRQRKKATTASHEVDFDLLGELVTGAYDQAERDRRRTDRSISLMVEELDQLNRGLERLVDERTAALRDRESRLAAQNLLIDAALNNMSQALLMFDAEARLVICNHRYLELYKVSPEIVRPGCTLRELIEHRKAVGTFSGDVDDYCRAVVADVAKGTTTSRIIELTDGRAVHAVNRPMAGGGWIATHEDVSERRHAEKQIAHMAHHDALTDLPNRVLLRDRLIQAERNRPDGERFAVFYLDLDNFKGINDTLGHQVGDELLKTVATRLRQCVPDHVTVARVGGDEFAIVLPTLVHLNDAAVLAQHICESIREPYDLLGQAIAIDTSIGIAIAPDDGIASDELMKNADMALYRAKADGRGTYRFFEPAMDASIKARRSLENELRKALIEGEFTLHYQPILNLNENRISTCEALIRWQHPERGMVSPADFIPVAEDIGLIIPIGEWVLRKACADAASWPKDIKVAVNLSPIQMMNANLMAVVIGALAASGLPASRLELEITESVMMQNTEATLATLHQLREVGVKISLDDFGTGFSSLSYLRRFPFDKLKIDRCFISDLSQADDALTIVRAVTTMAKSLGMITTAEGVETKEQLAQVRMLGCTEVQGYYIGRPQPQEQVTRLIASFAPRQTKTA